MSLEIRMEITSSGTATSQPRYRYNGHKIPQEEEKKEEESAGIKTPYGNQISYCIFIFYL